MNYGHFDATSREYVITKPNTPAPWANFLGSTEYGAIISNNAGGYSFVKSGANGRLLRYRFNESDRPGRYIYIRDDDDGDFWSASWQPVAKPLDLYKSSCRHGTGYSVLEASYKEISSRALYYVPLNKQHEVWQLTLKNEGKKPRSLSVFGYAELTNDGNYEQDNVNLQYTQFITRTYFKNRFIYQAINENCRDEVNGNARNGRFFALSGAKTESYCGDRAEFLGSYGDYSVPLGVKSGELGNHLNYNGSSCGALHTKIFLQPGQSLSLCFILGEKSEAEADALVSLYDDDSSLAEKELEELKSHWHGLLGALNVETPDENFNNMVNTWNAYQCFITFFWSRAASLTYCGLRNGYGYRDTVQDIQGIIHLAPELAREKIIFMLSAQMSHGGALPLVKFDHRAGEETGPEDPQYGIETGHPSYRADDALWLFPTVYKYIAETGDTAFLDEKILFADGGEDTVYTHLWRAIDFSAANKGIFGLPAGLHADWNDCLRLGRGGSSVFVAMQLYYALKILSEFAELKGDEDGGKRAATEKKAIGDLIEEHCWQGDRYLRGISGEGETVGDPKNLEGSLWLNSQSWAVISGCADRARSERILDLVERELNTDWGLKLMSPSYKNHPFKGALALLFNPGTKENGGIFLQSQGWIILAEALMGNGDRAFKYYLESSPAAQNELADIRRLEPYVYGQFTESSDSPFEGRSHVHWLTGTASTVMVGSVEGILGLRPDFYGLKLSPAIPSEWEGLRMTKRFRGKGLKIEVRRTEEELCEGRRLFVNGEELEGDYIPENKMTAETEILLLINR
ncbi:N,N'-diacetylchitobiose phosphorylase [Clostridiaceae bacterium OttesenSCG-928-D20]|nr:N,N'-diacetylchitobiose phosphorylase [Clostridiaceae bacterium OttesenSCG-928-D20]